MDMPNIDLHLPWTVDAEEAVFSPDEGNIVVTAADGGIALTVPFDPGEPADEDRARTTAAVICEAVARMAQGA